MMNGQKALWVAPDCAKCGHPGPALRYPNKGERYYHPDCAIAFGYGKRFVKYIPFKP